jgi:hypothetical protein
MAEEKKTVPVDDTGISTVADDAMYETGDIRKVSINADPALDLVAGGVIEYTEEEGKSVLSKIVSNVSQYI